VDWDGYGPEHRQWIEAKQLGEDALAVLVFYRDNPTTLQAQQLQQRGFEGE
jgi:hypothetical protein